jgi:hypothetical protein
MSSSVAGQTWARDEESLVRTCTGPRRQRGSISAESRRRPWGHDLHLGLWFRPARASPVWRTPGRAPNLTGRSCLVTRSVPARIRPAGPSIGASDSRSDSHELWFLGLGAGRSDRDWEARGRPHWTTTAPRDERCGGVSTPHIARQESACSITGTTARTSITTRTMSAVGYAHGGAARQREFMTTPVGSRTPTATITDTAAARSARIAVVGSPSAAASPAIANNAKVIANRRRRTGWSATAQA